MHINPSHAKFLNNNKRNTAWTFKISAKGRNRSYYILYQLESQLCHWFYRDGTTTTCTCPMTFHTRRSIYHHNTLRDDYNNIKCHRHEDITFRILERALHWLTSVFWFLRAFKDLYCHNLFCYNSPCTFIYAQNILRSFVCICIFSYFKLTFYCPNSCRIFKTPSSYIFFSFYHFIKREFNTVLS